MTADRFAAGQCLACGQGCWHTAHHARTEETFLLWPDPSSVYAMCLLPDGNHAGAVPFCKDCVPEIGESLPQPLEVSGQALGPIVDVVPAPLRYGAWYTARWGEWLRDWLIDHLDLPEATQQTVLADWQRDAEAARIARGA